MRSSKSRSRSKGNRSRSVGNIVNRVFDSSGPEGKVRGTPQQIIEKYTQLARDASLGNDRVAAENFQQHAEHYTRMLGEAQREMDARREQQEQQNRDRQRDRYDNSGNSGDDNGNGNGNGNGRGTQSDSMRSVDQSAMDQPDVIEDVGENSPQPDLAPPARNSNGLDEVVDDISADSGLVETPESAPKPKPKPRTRTPRKPKAKAETVADDSAGSEEAASESGDKAAKAAE